MSGRDGLLVVADDLSGAMETAAALGPRVIVGLDWRCPGGGVDVVDADTRRHPEHEVPARVAAVTQVRARVRLVKIDSLLRGHVRATVAAVREPGRSVVVCPALPLLSREVRNAVVLVDGTPLHQTALWHVEPTDPPASILDLLPSGARIVPADEVGRWLREDPGAVLVPDASTQADVRTIVEAVHDADGPVDLVGGSEIARQWAALSAQPAEATRLSEPALSTAPELVPTTTPEPVAGSQLFLLGSAAHVVREQVTAFGPEAKVLVLTAQGLRRDPSLAARRVLELLGPDRPTLVQVPRETGGVIGTDLTSWLGALARASDAGRPDLFLCGGETARTVLDELGIHRLKVISECHPGAALAVADDGRLVCTRPGSHGPRDSLLTIHRAMRAARNPSGSAVLQN